MRFILAGRVFDLPSLSNTLDREFLALHTALIGGGAFAIQPFKDAVRDWLLAGNDSRGDDYFNAFTILWQQYLQTGQDDRAEWIWEFALDPVLAYEKLPALGSPPHVHKGTAFYFWGMTAILRGNLDKGYALMHQALEEDLLGSGGTWPSTPSTALAVLDSAEERQAFRGWVLALAAILEEYLEVYRTTRGGGLALADFQGRFLKQPAQRDAAFLLSYVLARFRMLRDVPPYALESPFVSQLQLNLLFDIAVVIESAIKAKSGVTGLFKDQAAKLAIDARLSLSGPQLREANGEFRNDFETAMTTLLDESGSILADRTTILKGREQDVTVAYGIRNLGGHSIKPFALIRKRREAIEHALFNTLFLTVETYY